MFKKWPYPSRNQGEKIQLKKKKKMIYDKKYRMTVI